MKELVTKVSKAINTSTNKDDIKSIINTLTKTGVLTTVIDLIFIVYTEVEKPGIKDYAVDLINKIAVKKAIKEALEDEEVLSLLSILLEDDNNGTK